MSEKIAIVTDSIACLPKALVDRYGIEIVPIRLSINNKVYQDGVDITASEAYEALNANPDTFNTSPSSPGHYLDVYKKVSAWASGILCITLSSKLSMGFRSAQLAMEQAQTELPRLPIQVMDSQTVTAAEGFIALAAARAAETGASLGDVIGAAENVREKVSFYALLETIKHVYRTGRVPRIASQIGSALRVKPMLTSADGLIHFKGIVNSREKGIQKLISIMEDRMGERPAHIGVMHACAPDEAADLKTRIESRFNCTELWISEFTPVMGYATGTGTLAVAFYAEE